MGFARSEAEIAERTARFIKAELKRANVTYDDLAERLKEHGLAETRNSITAKLTGHVPDRCCRGSRNERNQPRGFVIRATVASCCCIVWIVIAFIFCLFAAPAPAQQ